MACGPDWLGVTDFEPLRGAPSGASPVGCHSHATLIMSQKVTKRQRGLHVHEEAEILQESATAGDSRSPYRRDNHIGDDVDEDARLSVEQIEKRATPKALWIAKTVLRREATVLCPHCLDVDDEPVPISDPCEHVPREIVIPREGGKNICVELAVIPKAHRYCERCGTVSFGGPLADRGFEEFRAVLDELCESARFVNYPENRLEKERSDALAAKGREEGPHDVTIVREFVANLTSA